MASQTNLSSVLDFAFGEARANTAAPGSRAAVARKIACLAAAAFACVAATGASAAELAPGNGQSVRMPGMGGVVYYTVEQDGYRVVATLASGTEQQPTRFISTLAPGQRMVISVPQAADQPSVDLEIVRDGGMLLVNAPAADDLTGSVEPVSIRTALQN
jgi:hypothetical protein